MIAGGRSNSYNDDGRQFEITESLDRKQAEQRHAHQGLGRPGLVVAIVYYSPWVMPGRSSFQHLNKTQEESKREQAKNAIVALSFRGLYDCHARLSSRLATRQSEYTS